MRKMVGMAVAGALLLPAAASADNICAPSSDPTGFYACASVSVNWDASTNSIVLAVRNLDAWDSSLAGVVGGYRLIGVGLTGDPSIADYLLGTLAVGTDGLVDADGNPASYWEYTDENLADSNGNGSGTVLVEAGAVSDKQNGAIIGCNDAGSMAKAYFRTCAPGFPGSVTFTFHMSPTYTAAMFGDTEWSYALRGQAGPNDASFKCEGVTCVPTTTVPEPVSMILLGTGLLGVGFIGRRRRNAVMDS